MKMLKALDTTLAYEEDYFSFHQSFNYSVDDNISLQFDYGFNHIVATDDIHIMRALKLIVSLQLLKYKF